MQDAFTSALAQCAVGRGDTCARECGTLMTHGREEASVMESMSEGGIASSRRPACYSQSNTVCMRNIQVP